MDKLTRSDLYSLEQYAENRLEIRAQVMKHKKSRNVHIGPTATLYFEDRQTIQYQIQEMLRVERIFEVGGIEEELQAYNPLIPDGSNWKATFMIEEPEVEKRHDLLARLIGVEDRVWVRVDGNEQVFAIADEDMDRDTEEKTSAVHFLRFELSEKMISDIKQGAALGIGIDHRNYSHEVEPVAGSIQDALIADLA
ncbi:MAG TPA: DUF3501 family protein [Gammaproteobacteria bacterium]|nr:DUF3501 family protein [Gammaproteobacteria bacterium]